MIDHTSAAASARLPRISAWAALGWVLALALASGSADSPLRADELGMPLLAALGLAALALVLLERARRLASLAGLATMVLAGTLLLKWSMSLDAEDLLDNRAIDGVSVLGRLALGIWLFAAGLAGWGLALASLAGLTTALMSVAALSMMVSAACVFVLSCWAVFAEWPGSPVLLSLPTLAAAVLLTLALLLAAWAQVGRRSRSAPHEGYRWLFARQLALLLSTAVLAGLAAAALVSAHTVELLSEGLQSRSARQAQALERYVSRSAAVAQALVDGSGRPDRAALTQELKRTAEQVQMAGSAEQAAAQGWPAAAPVLRTAELSAGLQADGGVRIELAARPGRPSLLLQLHYRQVPGLFSDDEAQPFRPQQLLCMGGTAGLLDCADVELRRGGRPLAPRFEVWTGSRGPGGEGLTEIAGPFEGRTLAALAPVGTLGTQLALKVSASSLLRMLGGPLLEALLLLTGLGLLGAAWSYWRQLPGMRELFLSRAQAQATMQHLPLATLVLDDSLSVLQANPAAEQLLGATQQALQGRPIGLILPGWRLGGEAGPPAALRLEALDAQGAPLPVEVSVARFTELGAQRVLLMLRDLRLELRDARDLQRWRRVFDDAGWGMVLASPGLEPVYKAVNPAYAHMLGYLPAELLGRPIRECIAESFWDGLLALREAAERSGSVQAQLRHRRRDGSELPTLLSLSAVRDELGQVSHFVVSVQDISALKSAEEAATRHATQLRTVLDALPVGVWIGDAQGQVLQTNRTARLLWSGGGSSDAPPAEPWWRGDRRTPLDHDSLMRRAAILRAPVGSGWIALAQADGSERTVLTTASPILDASGAAIGAIAIDEDLSSLRRGELALRQAHDLLERILEACAVGIALCDGRGQVLRRNLAWNLLIGTTADADALDATLEAGDTLRQRDLIARVARGELPTYVGEHRLRRSSGAVGWTVLVVSRLPGAADEPAKVLVQVQDIDDRRQVADEIAGSHLRLAAAQKLARMGDWQWDIASGRVSCSEQMLSMLGLGGSAQRGLSRDLFEQMLHPDDRQPFTAALDRALLSLARLDIDVRLIRQDGVVLIVNLHGVAQRTPAGMSMAGTMQDVTERKRIESELRESRERLRELMAYEGELIEEERKRIAREVHDELGQLLTALRLDLAMLRSQLPPDAAALARVEQMRQTMATMTDVVRHIAANLRPAALDLGLTAAIEWLAEDFSLRWETRCELQLPREHEPELSEAASLALFRAVQESLTNIAKHAQASRVAISMSHQGGVLRLRVSDDGHGFDPAEVAARRGGGLGLLGMRERMHAIGAQLAIQTGAEGTSVEISYNIAS